MKSLYEYIVKPLKPTRGIVGDHTQITDGDFKAVIKHFPEPSEEYGIDGGKISKLWIKNMKTNKVVVNYDRGWDTELDKNDSKLKKFYEKILKDFN